MAPPPKIRNISLDALGELPEELRPAFENLVGLLNLHLPDVGNALDRNLSVSSNLGGRFETKVVKCPEYPWTAISSFSNSWVDFGSTTTAPPTGWLMLPGGICELRGAVKSGTLTNAAFTLPFAPAYREHHVVYCWSGAAQVLAMVRIDTDGAVKPFFGNNNEMHLGGIRFFCSSAPAPLPFSGAGWPLVFPHGLNRPPKAVLIAKVRDLGTGKDNSHGGLVPDWDFTAKNEIRIRSIYGLNPGRTYEITFLLLPD